MVALFFFTHVHFPASGRAVVTGVVPSPSRFLPSFGIAHRVQQSHCSSICHRVLPTHALALSARQFVPKKKSTRIPTNIHSAGLELTKLTYTRLEDNLVRHGGDRYTILDVNLIRHRGDRPIYYRHKNTLSCGIEDFVETHICKLCVILRSRVLPVVCPH